MVVCIVVTNGFSFVNLNLSDHNLTDLRQETFPFVPLRTYTKNEKKKKKATLYPVASRLPSRQTTAEVLGLTVLKSNTGVAVMESVRYAAFFSFLRDFLWIFFFLYIRKAVWWRGDEYGRLIAFSPARSDGFDWVRTRNVFLYFFLIEIVVILFFPIRTPRTVVILLSCRVSAQRV